MAPSDLIIRRRRRRRNSNSTSTITTRAVVAAKAKATRPKRGQYKKLQKQHVHQQEAIKQPKNVKKESTMDQDLFPSTTNLLLLDDDDDDHHHHHHHHDTSSSSSGCCTPKAQRFRIPEIETCPPAPKKQRVLSNCSSLMQRNPNNTRHIAFFAPPDLELFFFSALHDISV